ncbi:ABC transporter ATP-binding protein [Thioclava atlantica]|uniref:ABC transporter n=1 Tax=Thioclava atlantica TaxID=1317124 RepID=A0A085TT09_9RHOB|nr:sn-glycerol-3-phosphate ABC transporter ATP-binding protein UgpC [Thioclava atlantica]KFE33856.1 ABC transporter [Thioclava atlantica]
MATLKFEGLKKRYGAVEVLHDINLDVADGELISLVGASGCGKSTLLRMVAGLEDISGGQLILNDRVINDVAPKSRDIAMVFQNYALYPHKTVAENMGFSLKLRSVPRAEIDTAVRRAADLLGLTPYLDRYPKALSGGQRQRVAMGRAIVREPEVFLFDEPLSNLDATLRVQMRSEIRALQMRLGTTSLYVTHDQLEAMTMSDRIVVLNGGWIEQVGTPVEIYDTPRNIFVAQFIGSPKMNLIEGVVTSEGVMVGDTLLPIAAPRAAGTPLIVGIRPEHLSLGVEGPGALPMVLEALEMTGAETHVYGTIAGAQGIMTHAGRLSGAPGDKLWLTNPSEIYHLFDKETGLRLD